VSARVREDGRAGADAERGHGQRRRGAGAREEDRRVGHAREPVWNSNIQPDFNVRVRDSFDAISSAVLRELDESNRSVQKSAESTSI
jgi:hypothetical protein